MVDLIEYQSNRIGHKTLYTFLLDSENAEATLTYAELAQRAKHIGQHLQQIGCANRPVLLCFPSGLDFIEALYGCFYAGAIAVPIHFPHNKRLIPRISNIVSDSQASLCLSSSAHMPKLEKVFANPAFEHTVDLIAIDEIQENGEMWENPNLDGDSIAFLQYTSGSTNVPKGTVITHANLLSNLQTIEDVFEMNEDTKLLLWVPPTHDMGLVGGILSPPYYGGEFIGMSPTAFTENPSEWLKAVTNYRATVTASPNFGMDYCVERVTDEDMAQLDLSSIKVMCSGAERIRVKTFEKFYEKFSQVGLPYESLTPSYGMAEATLVVTGYQNNEVYKTAAYGDQEYVSCGPYHPSFELCIVETESQSILPEGEVGEIWLSGPSVSSRYWGRSGNDLENFHQTLDEKPGRLFLRTGDYGFLKDGEVYITGRLKDLIIYNGVNYFAPDIESVVEKAHPAVATQGAAILPVDDGVAEHIVILSELRRTHRKADQNEVATAIQSTVGQEFILPIQEVVFLKPGQLPRTSSGKISKHLCSVQYKSHTLAELGRIEFALQRMEPDPAACRNGDGAWQWKKDRLRNEFARLLSISSEQVDFERPIMGYGIDSIKLAQLNVFMKEAYGTAIPFDQFEAQSSLEDILQTLPPAEDDLLASLDLNIQVHDVPVRNLLERARQFKPVADLDAEDVSLPYFRELSSNEGTICRMGDRSLLMFGSNNYLGLTVDPRVREAASRASLEAGPSATGSRLLNGTLTAHRQLEEKLAMFVGREDALVFTTGYQANIGLLSALLLPNSTLFVDERCHASIYDGAFVANASVIQFAHNDPADLALKISHLPRSASALIMIDGVYSMEGTIGNLPAIKAVAAAKNIPVLLDDAHALGMLGRTGRGTEEYFGTPGLADCISGTFSKSMASIGGWVAGDKDVLDCIRYKGRSMIFSASMPPPAVAAASTALDILIAEPERVRRLKENARYWREGLQSIGCVTGPTETAVVPVLVGDEVTCLKVNQALIDHGVYTNAALHPAVPRGEAILRTSVMATHTQDHMDQALEAFKRVKQKFA